MKPYVPENLPLKGLDYELLIGLATDASSELGRYDGLLQGIPNPDLMLSPLSRREALLSSQIEGTQATVDEVLQQEAGVIKNGEKNQDIQEITNYRLALFNASKHLKVYPISLSLVRELHKILLDGVRGHDQTPGEFRLTQNWIGKRGCTIEEATFIPPGPLRLQDYLEAWEQYLEFNENDFLLQMAIVHAQFELIHPFKDGNGRIGRILIPLFLYQKKKLSQPMFYLSEYLEANREEYYQRLKNISENGDWNGWVAFFLTAISKQAIENNRRAKEIMALYEEMKGKVSEITHSRYSGYLLEAIFNIPLFRVTDFLEEFHRKYGVKKITTRGLLRQLKNEEILMVLSPGSGQRSAILYFPRLIELLEEKTSNDRFK